MPDRHVGLHRRALGRERAGPVGACRGREGPLTTPEQVRAQLERFQDDYGPCHPSKSCGFVGCDACAARVVRFFREVLGIEPDEWQLELILAYGRGDRGITVKACHGPGKTLCAAGCAWHQCITRFPHHGVVTAPTKSQLYGAFMKEMRTIHARLPEGIRGMFEVTNDKVVKKDAAAESLFEARTAREEKPEALQGVHCDLGWVLIIVDEASGVHEKIFESGSGSMSGFRVTTILLSNPTRTSGYFYNTHMKPGVRENWTRISVSADQSPRVDPRFKAEVAANYGLDSNAYRVRVLGEFPKSDLDTVIPFELVETSRGRDVVVDGEREVWAVDVARFGDDDNVLLRRTKRAVNPNIMVWNGLDLMQTVGKVKAEWDKTPVKLRPTAILVDEIGMGGGVLDRLREMGLPAFGVNVAETASMAEKYRNLRSELWFLVREWFDLKTCALPRCEGGCSRECAHERLANELVMPRYKLESNGKLMVEPKHEMKKRGHKSPNIADALCMTFAHEAAGAFGGSGDSAWGNDWNKPVTRNLGRMA